MSMYYVATRASFKEMETAVGARVGRLNQKMAATLRKAAMKLDIRQNTRDGGRLEFYSVDQSGYDMLTDGKTKMFAILKGAPNVRPLAYLVEQDMNAAIDAVNKKYGGRMDYATHRKYMTELKNTTGALLVKLEPDVKTVRESRPKLGPNPYRVGDLFTANWEYSAPKEFRDYANCRVARATDAYVWLEYVNFKDTVGVRGSWSNTDSARTAFDNVESYGTSSQWENHGHFIPLKHNAGVLDWFPVKDYKGRLIRHRWDKVAGYRVRHLGQTGEVGYCYSTEPNYN